MNVDHFISPAPIPIFEQKTRGRPRVYGDEVALDICDRIGAGEDLHDICARTEMPTVTTVMRWTEQSEEFKAWYRAALRARAVLKCKEMEKVAKDGSQDYQSDDSGDGMPTVKPNKESLGRSTLVIETIRANIGAMLRNFAEPVALPPIEPAVPADPAAISARGENVVSLIDQFGLRGTAVVAK